MGAILCACSSRWPSRSNSSRLTADCEPWPHHLLLVVDVLTSRRDELLKRVVVTRFAGLAVEKRLQQLLAVILLADPLVGQLVTVAERLADRRPEPLFFDGLVPRLGDDEVLHHRLQATDPCTVAARRNVEDLQHAQYALMLLAKKCQCIHTARIPLGECLKRQGAHAQTRRPTPRPNGCTSSSFSPPASWPIRPICLSTRRISTIPRS